MQCTISTVEADALCMHYAAQHNVSPQFILFVWTLLVNVCVWPCPRPLVPLCLPSEGNKWAELLLTPLLRSRCIDCDHSCIIELRCDNSRYTWMLWKKSGNLDSQSKNGEKNENKDKGHRNSLGFVRWGSWTVGRLALEQIGATS